MATVTPRRTLVFQIQKRLSDLSASQLLRVASSIDDGGATSNIDDLSEPELYDLIVHYIRSEKLLDLEDGGMSHLLLLEDMLSDLLATDTEGVGANQAVPSERGDIAADQPGCHTPPHPDYNQPDRNPTSPTTDIPTQQLHLDRDACPNPSTENRDFYTQPARSLTIPVSAKSLTAGVGGAPHGRLSLTSSMGEQVSDDFLFDQITKSTSEEEERLKRLGTVAKDRRVTISTVQLDSSDSIKQAKVDIELQANRAAITELTAQVSSLTKHLAQMGKPTDSATPRDTCPPAVHPQATTTETRGRCRDCVQQGKRSCPHCFVCGQAGHRAIGCLKSKMSGNGLRSLERGSQ
ncbi:hypothetical protein VZT92_012612 [Zoarces viviparus]|uniref:CCHC-type domain-containing protein n=1 Tax=Zoarces viviparus TaxID=48416 RepID=A0AAW1F2E1_ZOAVI